MRTAHVLFEFFRQLLGPACRFIAAPARRSWALPLCVVLLGFLLIHPLDGPLSRFLRSLPLAGDIKRELTAWQQYGALTSILVVGAIVALLDTARWRQLLDLAAASILTVLACNILKGGIGRPRPLLNDPHTFLGPWGMYPVPIADPAFRGGARTVLSHAWGGATSATGPARRVTYELWSMPSSHTAAAVVLSVFLIAMYPRLKHLAIALALLVALTRVITAAHWPSDVIVGAAVGYAVALPTISRHWGIRALDWAWQQAVDPAAAPTALPLRDERTG